MFILVHMLYICLCMPCIHVYTCTHFVFMLYAPLHTLAEYTLGACCRCSIYVLSIFSIHVCVIYTYSNCVVYILCIVYICCIYACCINVVCMFYTCFICNVPHAELGIPFP